MPALSRPPSWPTSLRRGRTGARAAPWGVLLVLAGLFGMHGLSGHGACEDAGEAVTAHTSAMPTPMAGPDLAPGAGASPVAALSARGLHGGPGGVAELCLGMLTGFLLGMAAWLQARRPSAVVSGAPRLASLPRPRGRDPDPPSPARLSVWRC